jgi:hypothetical protein
MNDLESKINRLRTQTGMTVGDAMLLMFILLFALLFFSIIPRWALPGGKVLEIRAGDKVVGRYSLNNHKVIKVSGQLGTTSVIIDNGRARIQSSPCRNKICCAMGEIGNEGGILVCVPNQVIVAIAGERAEDLDAVSR